MIVSDFAELRQTQLTRPQEGRRAFFLPNVIFGAVDTPNEWNMGIDGHRKTNPAARTVAARLASGGYVRG